jgi:hypothetical protein
MKTGVGIAFCDERSAVVRSSTAGEPLAELGRLRRRDRRVVCIGVRRDAERAPMDGTR